MTTKLDALINSLEGIETITDSAQVAKLSQDYHTFSPVLVPKLEGKVGDIVVRPANEAEVLKVAAACAKHRVPITVRGAGTGNYGQCVPLHGGVILDMTRMQEILWVKPGVARVEAGVKLAALDKKNTRNRLGNPHGTLHIPHSDNWRIYCWG